MWDNYITRCPRRFEPVRDKIPKRENQRQTEGFGPSVTHSWATPAKMRKKSCYGQKNLGQYVAVCSHLQLTSHSQPTSTLSRMKCERYIFIKKCVRSLKFVIIVDYVSAYIFICICMQLYNIYICVFVCIVTLYLERDTIQTVCTYCDAFVSLFEFTCQINFGKTLWKTLWSNSCCWWSSTTLSLTKILPSWNIFCLSLYIPPIKRCTYVNKRKNSRSRWALDNYITRCLRRFEPVEDKIPKRENQQQTEGFGPSMTLSWATPAKMRKKCCNG